MRVVIIGAGISGLIAKGAFTKDNHDVTVCDPKLESGDFSQHKAVMRLRDDRVNQYVNCRLKPITVTKAIYHKGEIHNKPNILLNNLYSLKNYGALGNRSLETLGEVDRFLITGYAPDVRKNFIPKRVKGISMSSGAHFRPHYWLKFSDESIVQYDICISTIPMPALMRLEGINLTGYENISFSYNPIYVSTADLLIPSDVHQTLYFTQSYIYRVTIEGQKLIIESTDCGITQEDFRHCVRAFGLDLATDVSDFKTVNQEIGKIVPIDDDARRRIMMDLTNKYNIYSFGRFATWKPLRVDQTIDDIEKIKMLIRVGNKNYYS